MFHRVKNIIAKYKGLVVSTFLTILALFMIVTEDGFLSILSPIPHSGCRAWILNLAYPGNSACLVIMTKQTCPLLGYELVTRRYWIGNTLYVKAIGIIPPPGSHVMGAAMPATELISLEEIAEGSYQVVLFWCGGLLNVKTETYDLEKYEGNISLDRVESDPVTVFFANILYLTPWLLLCTGLAIVLVFVLMKIIRRPQA